MIRPQLYRGEVLIKTRFGVLSAEPGTWGSPIEELVLRPEWIDVVGLQGGPFCLTDEEREIPW